MDQDRWRTVNHIFHAALEVSPSERHSFVLTASNGDPEVQAEVELLLEADQDAGSYLETPLVPEAVFTNTNPPVTPGDVLCNRFRILRAVGEGGMGHVFEAYDSELAVHVALKIIRPEIASNPEALTRFRQEVRLARRITHPNVCRTFDIEREASGVGTEGEARQALIFLTMEFLQGETLDSRIKRSGALLLDDALQIAKQIADAMAAAHSLGILHRDMKPANIMLVPADSATDKRFRAVITDFGLARLDSALLQGHRSALSLSGRPIGTLAYMSPEQLEGAAVSTATDVYAFGLILFEMVTGSRAFPSDNFLTGIAKRLNGQPPSAAAVVPSLPARWGRAIEGCLRLRPTDRFESATAAVAILDGGRIDVPRVGRRRLVQHLLLTSWPLQRRLYVVCALFLAAMALFFGRTRLYQSSANSKVDPGALIYLTQVKNLTGERSLDDLTELLRASLGQSAQINLLDQSRVGDTLQLMTKAPDTAIDSAIARQIAMRTGAARVVFATVAGSAGSYRLNIDIQQPDSTPSRYREHWNESFPWKTSTTAVHRGTIPQELLNAIRRASDWIRFKAGESRNDIAHLDSPPEDVTTGNWEALEKYEEAMRFHAVGKTADAVYSLQNAVEIDPQFALAFGRLGDLEVSVGRFSDGFKSYEKALDTEEDTRLTRRERDRLRGLYAMDTGDYAAAEAAFRDYSIYYPNDYLGSFYRGYPLMMLGRTEEALETLRHSLRLDSSRSSPPLQLGLFDAALGNFAEAHQMADHLKQTGYAFHSGTVLGVSDFIENHYKEAMTNFERIGTEYQAQPSDHPWALSMQARIAAERGEYQMAASFLNQAIRESAAQGDVPEQAAELLDRAYIECKQQQFPESLEDVRRATSMETSAKSRILAGWVLGQDLVFAPDHFTPSIRQELTDLISKSSTEHFGMISDISRYLLHGYLLIANHRWNEAIPEFRKASALDAPGHPRAYLPQSLVIVAAHTHDPATARALRTEALSLYAQISFHPSLIWYSAKNYPPGYYADQIDAYLELAKAQKESGNDFDRANALYVQLRPREQSIH
jgi:eukaryotic-like serine/threonine-protein kinase